MAFAPTLVAKTDMVPVPRVEITFGTVDASTERATVYRLADDRTFRVRGGVDVYAAGGFSLVDFETPFGIESTYRAEMFDAAGLSLGFTDPAVVTLGYVGAVIHQPVDPGRAVAVTVLQGTADSLVRPFLGDLILPKGRSVPVWIGTGRGALEGVSLQVLTDSAESEAAFRSVFGEYGEPQIPVICFRSSLNLGLPKPLFALIRAANRVSFDAAFGGSAVTWDMSGDEAAPPVEALVVSQLAYTDFEDVFLTYSALEAAYLTYLALESDYSMAGS